MRLATVFALSLLIAAPALAQTPGNCITGTASATLDANDVRAELYNTGNLFERYGDGGNYVVPEGSGLSPLYTAGLWVGGKVDDEIRTAAATYPQAGANYEFWPGPLEPGGSLPDPDDCFAFDRLWSVTRQDIEDYDAGGTPSDDLAEWPADLGAPFIDANNDGAYALEDGDRPDLNGADQGVWWVMNDVGNDHESTGSLPLRIEVRVLAYAYDRPGLETTTFYDYEIVNRSDNDIADAYVSFFADPDIGGGFDDYVGSDPELDLGFGYNADNFDEDGYGAAPPALGFDLLRGPVIDEGGRPDTLGMTKLTYFLNAATDSQSDPDNAQQFYNYMAGFWADGLPFLFGGDGRNNTTGGPTDFVFPDDPPNFWSEPCTNPSCSASAVDDDRRLVLSTGPLLLSPGQSESLSLAVIWARGSDHLDSVEELKASSRFVQAFYDNGFAVAAEGGPTGTGGFALGAAYPNPAGARVALPLTLAEAGAVRVEAFDLLGRRVALLHDGPMAAGRSEVAWDVGALPSGVYVVRASGAAGTAVQRVVVQ